MILSSESRQHAAALVRPILIVPVLLWMGLQDCASAHVKLETMDWVSAVHTQAGSRTRRQQRVRSPSTRPRQHTQCSQMTMGSRQKRSQRACVQPTQRVPRQPRHRPSAPQYRRLRDTSGRTAQPWIEVLP